MHQADHASDAERRSLLTRWAITSIISGLGVLIALYVAFRRGG